MNAKIATAIERLELYTAQVKAALDRDDPFAAMPHLAELAEIDLIPKKWTSEK